MRAPIAHLRRFRFVIFSVTVAILGVCFLLSTNVQGIKSFPDLKPGAYLGQVRGLDTESKDPVSLYVERLRSINALLFILFQPGWQPRLVRLDASISPSEDTLPVVHVHNGTVEYQFSGSRRGERFSGELQYNENRRATWSLAPITGDTLRQDISKVTENFDLTGWLRVKSEHEAASQEKSRLTALIADQESKLAKLAKISTAPELLRERSVEKEKQLEEILAKKNEARRNAQAAFQSSVQELQQLTRITKRGRSVDLARRVAKREAKWYLANWEETNENFAFEEQLAQQMNVDLRKLNMNVKKAEELRLLRSNLERERSAVQHLLKQYQDRVNSSKPSNTNKKGEEERPWWKKWDSIF